MLLSEETKQRIKDLDQVIGVFETAISSLNQTIARMRNQVNVWKTEVISLEENQK